MGRSQFSERKSLQIENADEEDRRKVRKIADVTAT